MLVEVSWEVCNKVGGIHTVLTSKLPFIQHKHDDYLLIGPYLGNQPFAEEPLPEAFHVPGVKLHYGRWMVKGCPKVLLVEIDYTDLNAVKKILWETFGVSSILAGHDYDEPVMWSWLVGKVVAHLQPKNVHVHEWLSGATLLYLHTQGFSGNTVFTTHATVLGRTLASNGVDLYDPLLHIDAEMEAKRFGVEAKHGIEKATAQTACKFTTVSAITAKEAERFLGRKADALLPNGLTLPLKADVKKLPTLLAKWGKKGIIFTIAGRYEFRDKGFDIFLDALHIVKAVSKTPFVACFFSPAGHGKKLESGWSTHELPFEDPIRKKVEAYELQDHVFFHPKYLDENDIGLSYYDALGGSDLGVFPSYYEPWGYTPLEGLALGVPSITSDVAGFGMAVKGEGVFVISRHQSDEQASAELARLLLRFLHMSKGERSHLRVAAKKVAHYYSWEKLVGNYENLYLP